MSIWPIRSASYFKYQKQEEVAEEIANHLRLFWDPRMRKAIVAHLNETGGAGLEGPCLRAVELLRDDKKKPESLPSTAKCDASGGREDPG